MPTPTHPNEETVDAVARSLHRHHEERCKGTWKYDDLDETWRNEYRDRAGEIITALQGTETVEEATMYLAKKWCQHGPALAKMLVYAHARITETLSDVPTLKETK